MKKIVVTGGHHTTALSVIEEIKKRKLDYDLDCEIIWIGHKFSMWGDRNVSAEYREIMSLGIRFINLKTGKFYRTAHPLKLLRIPFGFLQALFYLGKINPDLVISFGGYLSVPVAFAASLLGVPLVIHEQTASAGLGNRVCSRLARKVFISFSSSKRYFPENKTFLIGNPLRREIFFDGHLFKFRNDAKTIYITGGKQGSHRINDLVAGLLPVILFNYNVIHQSGSSSVYEDLVRLSEIKSGLSEELRERYVVKDFFGREEIGSVFARADLIIGRAGANTVYEIGALGKPALLIPIAWSSFSEQEENARFLVSGGGALVLGEKTLRGERLLSEINKIFSDYSTYQKNALGFSRHFKKDADRILADEALLLISQGRRRENQSLRCFP